MVLLTVAKHVLEDKIVEPKLSSFPGRLAHVLLQVCTTRVGRGEGSRSMATRCVKGGNLTACQQDVLKVGGGGGRSHSLSTRCVKGGGI